jgi:hypothetical protein
MSPMSLQVDFIMEPSGREYARLSAGNYEPKPVVPTKADKAKEAIIKHVRDNKLEEGFETKQILDALAIQYPESTLEAALTTMVREKLLERPVRGYYKLLKEAFKAW